MSYHCLLRRWLPLEHVCSRQPLATGVLGRLFIEKKFLVVWKYAQMHQNRFLTTPDVQKHLF
jgi:hypothetical protein